MVSGRSVQSVLTYNLTRPYPYAWLTPVVLVTGVILATLFSFAAVASIAYEFESIYTTDPNTTENTYRWFQRAPFSWISENGANCQPALLTAGATYVTSNRAFTYSLNRMRTVGSNSQTFSAAGYQNTTMEDCQISSISVDLLRRDNTRVAADQDFWSWGATTAMGQVSCNLTSQGGVRLQVNLTTQLPRTLNSNDMLETYLAQNTSSNANMWYGFKITRGFYSKMSLAMSYSVPGGIDGTSSWGAGTITFTRNPNVTDYENPAFFVCDIGLSTDSSGLNFMHPPHTVEDWATSYQTGQNWGLPNISITADAFAKSFYSLLLMDFGMNVTTNALLTPRGIQYLQAINDTDLALASGKDIGHIGKVYVPGTGLALANSTKPVTLFSQYLCSVPRPKNAFSVFVAVILADIVFLNSCWTVFGWGLNYWVGRRDPSMMQCETCRTGRAREVVAPSSKPRDESEEILLQPSAAWSRS